MDRHRWARVQALFDAAVTQPPGERSRYLELECGDDIALLSDVKALLQANDEAGDWLDGAPAPVTSTALPAGHMFGPYRISGELGAGGMSVVYRALDTRLDRPVALKVLAPHLTRNEGARARLLIEARAASQIDHPNICTIYDIGDTGDGNVFIAMALYDGQTLQARLKQQGALAVTEALDIAGQIAEGLGAAHAAGILHRDIKPANVVVTDEGVVKLIDFGIAKMADVQLTATGATLGTFAYMSPEQLRGEAVDERADLWSLGAVLHEMLSGRRAFQGESLHSIMQAVLNEEPLPLRGTTPPLPAGLDAVVARLLAKDAAARYGSCARVHADLAAIAAGDLPAPTTADYAPTATGARSATDAPATVTGARSRQHRAAIGVQLWTLAAMVVVGALAWYVFRPTTDAPPGATAPGDAPSATAPVAGAPTPRPAGASIAVLPFVNLSDDPGQEYFADGLADSLLQRLSAVAGLKVSARTSSFAFRGRSQDVRTIGERLGVATVLEGSVQKYGDKVRIIVQLIDTADGSHLWARTFDRAGDDIFRIQDEISQAVADALEVALLETGESPPPAAVAETAQAYDLYLLGRQQWHLRTPASLPKAIEYFRAAIDADPDYARAYTGLADAHLLLLEYGDLDDEQAFTNLEAARKAIAQALALDPRLAEAHASLGLLRDYDALPAAEDAFRRAIELNPNYLNAYLWYGKSLRVQQRLEESLQKFQQALALDPVSYIVVYNVAESLRLLGRAESAIEHYRRAIELNAGFAAPYLDIAAIAYTRGDLAAAVNWFEQGIERDAGNAGAMAHLAQAYVDLGEFGAAGQWGAAALAADATDIEALRARSALAIARDQYRENLRLLRAALDQRPDSRFLLAEAAFGEMLLGNHQRARELYEQAHWAMGFDRGDFEPVQALANIAHALNLAYVYNATGAPDQGQALLRDQSLSLERLRARAPALFGLAYVRAGIETMAGDKAMAIASLREAVDGGWRRAWLARRHPVYAPLADDTGFTALMNEVERRLATMKQRLAQR